MYSRRCRQQRRRLSVADNYVIRKATLDGIAAQTMTLNGTTAAMTTEQMEQAVADANTEVTTQAAKIAELSTILDGKAGGGTPTYETCTVYLRLFNTTNTCIHYTRCLDGAIVCESVKHDDIQDEWIGVSGAVYKVISGVVLSSLICIYNHNRYSWYTLNYYPCTALYDSETLSVLQIPSVPSVDTAEIWLQEYDTDV